MHGSKASLKAWRLTFVLAGLAAGLTLSIEKANCQYPSQQQNASSKGQIDPNKVNKKPAWLKTGEALAKVPEGLKEKVSLPDVPEYTGKAKFLNGLIYDHVGKLGPCYVMNFNTKETSNQVIDWYRSVFQMYGWKIDYQDKDSINATNKKSGNMCILQVSGPVAGYDVKGDNGSYSIRYQYAKPQ
jgi:hypothetical protein